MHLIDWNCCLRSLLLFQHYGLFCDVVKCHCVIIDLAIVVQRICASIFIQLTAYHFLKNRCVLDSWPAAHYQRWWISRVDPGKGRWWVLFTIRERAFATSRAASDWRRWTKLLHTATLDGVVVGDTASCSCVGRRARGYEGQPVYHDARVRERGAVSWCRSDSQTVSVTMRRKWEKKLKMEEYVQVLVTGSRVLFDSNSTVFLCLVWICWHHDFHSSMPFGLCFQWRR